MAYKIVNLPKDEATVESIVSTVAIACRDLGVEINPQVFVEMWAMGDIKVILEQGEKIDGICLLRHGANAMSDAKVATILDIKSRTSVTGLYEFTKTVAQALNCSKLTATLTEKIDGVAVVGYYHEETI